MRLEPRDDVGDHLANACGRLAKRRGERAEHGRHRNRLRATNLGPEFEERLSLPILVLRPPDRHHTAVTNGRVGGELHERPTSWPLEGAEIGEEERRDPTPSVAVLVFSEQGGDERVDAGVPVKKGIDSVGEHGLPVARGFHVVVRERPRVEELVHDVKGLLHVLGHLRSLCQRLRPHRRNIIAEHVEERLQVLASKRVRAEREREEAPERLAVQEVQGLLVVLLRRRLDALVLSVNEIVRLREVVPGLGGTVFRGIYTPDGRLRREPERQFLLVVHRREELRHGREERVLR